MGYFSIHALPSPQSPLPPMDDTELDSCGTLCWIPNHADSKSWRIPEFPKTLREWFSWDSSQIDKILGIFVEFRSSSWSIYHVISKSKHFMPRRFRPPLANYSMAHQATTDNISFATQFPTISTDRLGFSPGLMTKRVGKYDVIYGKAADMVTSVSYCLSKAC